MTAGTGPEAESATGFRPDIEGLRAVAVLLILLYHAGLPLLPGGYVGVDVFFVISGFLITGLLVRELEATRRLELLEFYARRARRILPAAFLVLAVTAVLSLLVLSPIGFHRAAPDIAAAMAYVPNILFAFQRVDYFHPAHVSPVTHYWSLGVEEQFYVVWPALLWGLYRAVAGNRRRLGWLLAAIVAASFAASVVLTPRAPTAAFYLLPTRAWELGIGGLLALAMPGLRRLPLAASSGARLAGLALIGASAILFHESTPFPGVAAVAPVLGSALVVGAASGMGGAWASAGLTTRPGRYLGRISYSLYLWHWPLLVFAPIALAAIPAPLAAALAVVATFVLAAATYRWVEEPLRRGAVIGRQPRWNLAAALGMSLVLVAATLGTSRLAIARFRQPHPQDSVPVGADPFVGLIPPSGPATDGPLPANLIPPVLHLWRGEPLEGPGSPGCSLRDGRTVNGACTFGDAAATTKVVLLGDSHLAQWWPALSRIMAAQRWRVVVLIKTSCTYADVTAMGPSGPKTDCDEWRAAALDRIAREHPSLVILSANHRAPPVEDGLALTGAAADSAMQAGAVRTIDRLESTGSRVAIISDTPELPFDPGECLTAHADHVLRCAVPRAEALDAGWESAERAAAQATGATYVDANAWACASDPCPLVIGRYAVFADSNHLTRPFVQGLTRRLEAALSPVPGPAP